MVLLEGFERAGVVVELVHDSLEIVLGGDLNSLELTLSGMDHHCHLTPASQKGQNRHSRRLLTHAIYNEPASITVPVVHKQALIRQCTGRYKSVLRIRI
jgi:hypothetical protein